MIFLKISAIIGSRYVRLFLAFILGEYQCRAENLAGKTELSILVSVIGKYLLILYYSNIYCFIVKLCLGQTYCFILSGADIVSFCLG
jgi:hypothetical protein